MILVPSALTSPSLDARKDILLRSCTNSSTTVAMTTKTTQKRVHAKRAPPKTSTIFVVAILMFVFLQGETIKKDLNNNVVDDRIFAPSTIQRDESKSIDNTRTQNESDPSLKARTKNETWLILEGVYAPDLHGRWKKRKKVKKTQAVVPSKAIDNESNHTNLVDKGASNNNETETSLTTTMMGIPNRYLQYIPVSDTFGQVINNRLVVNVNHRYMFWNRGQSRLCNVLREMMNVSSLGEQTSDGIQRNPPLLNATIDCKELQKEEAFGQGNWVTALYCTKIAAALARVDFQFQCSDGRDSQMKLLLPWFDGSFPAPSPDLPWPYSGTLPSENEACSDKYSAIRVDKMAHQIRDDIQKMAVTLVGARDDKRQHPSIPRNQTPLISGVVLDEVVIHFRCGDVFGGAKRNDFGMIKFTEYKKWISRDARTIGILTQPFDDKLVRAKDRGVTNSCRQATYLLVGYLRESWPNATISIHNNENETLPLAYARLAMANQSFTSLSSFGIFPVIGTFGDGYFQKGNHGVNPFATHVSDLLSNVHAMNAPVLGTGRIRNMLDTKTLNETLQWFVTPS